jgi:hypothetical protein
VHIVAGVLLIISGVFNFAVWPTFYRRVANDPRARDAAGAPTRFLTVHRVIVGIAYALGALCLLGGIASLILPWY